MGKLNAYNPARVIAGERVIGGYHWGAYPAVTDLPNVAAEALDLHVGDLASVGSVLYACRTATSGSAVWDAVGTGNGGPWRLTNVTMEPGEADLAAVGQSRNAVVGTLFYGEIYIDHVRTITNVNVLLGTTIGTEAMRVHVYNESGTLLGENAAAGEDLTGATADDFKQAALSSALTVAPGRYFVGIQMDGVGTEFQVVRESFWTGRSEAETGHTFGETSTDITSVATGYTADVAPIFFLD